eukprot:CAMPEP_0194085302 /NCGR_PEP_ID=MMETSP0149-20130528/17122_1 /TAXON_ID=122233 /ORGANISM="Chaetoceros debilis, Strain MM31A-1" /LENGTH=56 /DNA_ID=CAMNT_0038768161 /DNA_START=22 /DNA_END=189 /DNA_ORIENTATION=-
MSEWSTYKVIEEQHGDDGSTKVNFYQGQETKNPTTDDNVRQILDKDGLDLEKVTYI